jgi:Probable cobalt transporter subunit (CbtB)
MSNAYAPGATVAVPTPVVVPAVRAAAWLIVSSIVALAIYYFIGVDQGATSVFGSNQMFIHEFVHDGRHFLGFPCH